MKKTATYGIDLNSAQRVALRLDPGEVRPFRLGWMELLPDDENEVAGRLGEMASAGRKTLLAMPNNDVALLVTRLPQLGAKGRRDALLGLIRRDKGGEAADWSIEHQVLPHRPGQGPDNDMVDITALIADTRKADELYGQAMALNIQPGLMLPDYMLLSHVFRQHGPCPEDNEAWNLVYLGSEEKYVIVGDADTILFTRRLPDNLSEDDQTEEYVQRLSTEIGRTVFFARQAERSMAVTRIAVCGDPELTGPLVTSLGVETGLEAVDWRVEDLCEWPDADPDWKLIVPLAAAITAGTGTGFNLIPPQARRAGLRIIQRRMHLGATTLATAAPVIVLFCALWTLHGQQGVLDRTTQTLEQTSERARQAGRAYYHHRALLTRQDNIDKFDNDHAGLAELLRDIAGRTPGKVILDDLELLRDTPLEYRLRLRGESRGVDSEAAQATFLAFLDELSGVQRLEAAAEPEFMRVEKLDEFGRPGSHTVFILEYKVRR